MRLLVDQNRSPRLAELLSEAGHYAVHTLDVSEQADDDAVLTLADAEHRVVVTGDTDFGALLAVARSRSPSVILFRARNWPRAPDQAQIILGTWATWLTMSARALLSSSSTIACVSEDCRSCTMTDGASLGAVTVLVTV